MKRTVLLVLVLAVVSTTGLVGCSSEIDLDGVVAMQVAYGRYARTQNGPALTEQTSVIRCEPGALFGVEYRVVFDEGGSGVLPVSFWWVHPDFAIPSRNLWGTETRARASGPRVERGEDTFSGRAIWALETPEEQISGAYRFEIRTMDDEEVLLAVPFTVEGCES